MQRIHLVPRFGEMPVDKLTTADVEAMSVALLKRGLRPKTVRNDHQLLCAVFEHAVDRAGRGSNAARRAARPKRRRGGDVEPDLHFLSVQLEAVIRAIPDEVVYRAPAPFRRGRPRPAPPPPPDVLGPVLRVADPHGGDDRPAALGARSGCAGATSTGPPNGSASATRTCAASTRPPASRTSPPAARSRWPTAWSASSSLVTPHDCTGELDLVFAHPHTGRPIDPNKVSKRFQQACRDAGVPVIRFHDLRHTFATRIAATGQPLRAIQEFLGHADAKTTQIYAHYAPSAHEVDMVNQAFAEEQPVDGGRVAAADLDAL